MKFISPKEHVEIATSAYKRALSAHIAWSADRERDIARREGESRALRDHMRAPAAPAPKATKPAPPAAPKKPKGPSTMTAKSKPTPPPKPKPRTAADRAAREALLRQLPAEVAAVCREQDASDQLVAQLVRDVGAPMHPQLARLHREVAMHDAVRGVRDTGSVQQFGVLAPRGTEQPAPRRSHLPPADRAELDIKMGLRSPERAVSRGPIQVLGGAPPKQKQPLPRAILLAALASDGPYKPTIGNT